MNKTILITGGNGATAQALAHMLINSGFNVHTLTRNHKKVNTGSAAQDEVVEVKSKDSKSFYWNPKNDEIDLKCFEGVFAIVHLAGESIFGMPWTPSRRRRILSSRIDSIDFLVKKIPSWQLPYIRVLLSASATGYYPANLTDHLSESHQPGDGFLSKVCRKWEEKIIELANWGGFREVRFRNGIILDKGSGVFKKLAGLTKYGLGTIPGDGKQYMPWIHIEDVCLALKSAVMDHQWSGVYNMVAPNEVSMKDICEGIANYMGRKIYLPSLPTWLLKVGMGDMSSLLLDSYKVRPDRLVLMNFNFKFPTLKSALADLSQKKH